MSWARRPSIRAGAGYAGFARRLYDAVRDTDPTRPVIENDWMEPDPERVFRSPLLTAHWYGRLCRRYLAELRDRATRWAGTGRPLLLSEFGDWGLPDLGGGDEQHFWRYGAPCGPWSSRPRGRPASPTRRRDPALPGPCRPVPDRANGGSRRPGLVLTELTDVPQEFDGLLDLLRRRNGPRSKKSAAPLKPCAPSSAARTGPPRPTARSTANSSSSTTAPPSAARNSWLSSAAPNGAIARTCRSRRCRPAALPSSVRGAAG